MPLSTLKMSRGCTHGGCYRAAYYFSLYILHRFFRIHTLVVVVNLFGRVKSMRGMNALGF